MSDLDLSGIPERVMVDTSFLVAARGPATEAYSAVCQDLWLELLRLGRHILIPAVALAEFMRRPPHSQPKRHARIEVVAFDERAAMALATRLPPWPALKKASGSPRLVTKYDEMILASAIRHRADVLISLDDGLIKAAQHAMVTVQDARKIPRLPIAPPAPRTGDLFPGLTSSRSQPARGLEVEEEEDAAPPKKIIINDADDAAPVKKKNGAGKNPDTGPSPTSTPDPKSPRPGTS
jgi:predicted nucleic acid-binding protein